MKKFVSFILCLVLVFSFSVSAFAKTDKKKETKTEDADYALIFENANGRVLSVAKYGDARNYPENSLEGIKACLEYGIDIVSVNVQKTNDDQLVLLTSSDLSITCAKKENGTFVGGSVSDYTLEELQDGFVLKEGHGGILATATEYKPASLADAIKAVKGKGMLLINDGWQYAKEIDTLAAELGASKSVILRDATSTKEIKAFLDGGEHVYVSAFFGPESDGKAKDFVDGAINAGALFVELRGEYSTDKIFKDNVLSKFANKGRAFVSMTEESYCGECEDRSTGWDQVIGMGVSVIETDYPKELATHLKQIESYRKELVTLMATADEKIGSKDYTKVTIKNLETAKDNALEISSKGAVTYEQIDSVRYELLEALDDLDVSDGKNDKVRLPGWLIFIIIIAAIVIALALAIVGLRIYNKVKKSNRRVKKVKDNFQIIAPEGNDSLTSITGEDLTVEDFAIPEDEEETPAEEEEEAPVEEEAPKEPEKEEKDLSKKADEYIKADEEKVEQLTFDSQIEE